VSVSEFDGSLAVALVRPRFCFASCAYSLSLKGPIYCIAAFVRHHLARGLHEPDTTSHDEITGAAIAGTRSILPPRTCAGVAFTQARLP
jgi:hypothetical protein